MAVTTTEMLARLVAFDTTSSLSNLPIIDFIESYLSERGIESRRVYSPEGDKANLWATLGPAEPGGVVVSSHTDCVPVEGQPWTTDPFTLTEQGDRLVGRGTSDMKGFIASTLVAIDGWLAEDLAQPIHLAFSHDEETGGSGARPLVADMAAAGLRPEYTIVGEPSSMQVVTAHKGIETFEATVTGTEAHSSLAPQAVNAVEYAARFVTALSDLAREKQEHGPFDHDFDLPHTTVHTGIIRGGTALNIVPRNCEIEFEYRIMPGESVEEMRAEFHRIADALTAQMPDLGDVGIVLRDRSGFPPLDTPDDSPAVARALSLTRVAGTGKVAYGTE
ncbi:MAG: acetylornithine deacetylase, partial [Acidimicrobiia bacterium]|nr:acetylornithine deacetylase [Acidimicrobiia bacterium]